MPRFVSSISIIINIIIIIIIIVVVVDVIFFIIGHRVQTRFPLLGALLCSDSSNCSCRSLCRGF